MALGLDRAFWTPLLIVAAVAVGFARTALIHRQGLEVEGELATAAWFGAVLGASLFPWAAGALVAYGHWFWHKTRQSREFMTKVYPYRRRRVLHATVLILLVLMVLELLWRLGQEYLPLQ